MGFHGPPTTAALYQNHTVPDWQGSAAHVILRQMTQKADPSVDFSPPNQSQ